MTAFRFMHAADIHLDSPLKGLADRAEAPAARIRGATREAFTALIDRCLADKVAFLIIAGDLYDGDWKDYSTGLFLVRELARLTRAGIAVFLVAGNHDAQSVLTRRLTLPEGVTLFPSRRPDTVDLPEIGVALHGQSYARREVTANLAADYPAPLSGRVNIGILHTAVAGAEGHEPYAPCTLAELQAKGYDYWALGHVHGRAILSESPWVVFSGNLQGRHIREVGPKGATRVTIEDGSIAEVVPLELDVVRWARLTVDVGTAADLSDALDLCRVALADRLAREEEGEGERLLACRLALTGTTPAHDALAADPDHVRHEMAALAADLAADGVWIESVRLQTRVPVARRLEGDALVDLMDLLATVAEDQAFGEGLHKAVQPLLRSLPAELRDHTDDPLLQAARDGEMATLIDQALPMVRAHVKR